ncbi:hypothetical protein ASG59_19390 [Methylobacterium sp. Leaf466]|nr:hypothetical protein ASG59_19390 [Methylobacterium sp. Leaf466]
MFATSWRVPALRFAYHVDRLTPAASHGLVAVRDCSRGVRSGFFRRRRAASAEAFFALRSVALAFAFRLADGIHLSPKSAGSSSVTLSSLDNWSVVR